MFFIAAAALSLAAAPAAQAAQVPAAQRTQIAWQRSLADALAAQQATGLPLLVVVNMDNEVFNDRFARTVYRDPSFVATTRGYVCVIASPDRHSAMDYDAAGHRIPCPRFGCCTCSEHIAIEPLLYERYFAGKRNAPRHIGVAPDGRILFDRYLDQSMQTAIDAVEKHRGQPPADQLAPDADLPALFARRDVLARELLEWRYRTGDQQTRRQLLQAAGTAGNEPFDLLRMGLRDDDGALCGLAALALAKTGSPDALIDFEDALARIDDVEVRRALLAQLAALGRSEALAARLAAHFDRAARAELPAPWRNAWRTPAFSTGNRDAIEAELDRLEARLRTAPDDAEARLALAIAQAGLAAHLAATGGRGTELWFEDARRSAQRVAAEELEVEAKAIGAIAAWYLGEPTAARLAAEAMSRPNSPRQPDGWLAAAFLDVLLPLTAQSAYARAEQNPSIVLRAELDRTTQILDMLAERGGGTEQGLLAGIGLLEFAGLRAEARERLAALARQHPASTAIHDRWRTRMLVDLGAERMRHAYAKFATDATDKAAAQWFAGYAALVAGDLHTRDDRRIEAENAYGDAVERFLSSAAANEDYADSARHYAVLALAGRAAIRQLRGSDRLAVQDLLRAAGLRPESLDDDDGLQRKPRAIAERVARGLRDAGQQELADQLKPLLP